MSDQNQPRPDQPQQPGGGWFQPPAAQPGPQAWGQQPTGTAASGSQQVPGQYPAPHPGQAPSRQPWNPQPGQGHVPQGAPQQGRPAWDPTQPFPTPGQPGRDPRAPMGAPIPAAVDIDQFREKRSRTPLLATLVVLALAVVAVVFGVHRMNRPAAAPATSASASAPVTPLGTASNNALSVAFENQTDNASGTWTITGSQWSGDRLLLTIRVHVDKGTQAMKYFAISNDSETQTYEPMASGRSDDLLDRQVAAGQTATGTVTFTMPDRSSTIFLAAANGRQVSGLVVPG